jgi:hypothetical protein
MKYIPLLLLSILAACTATSDRSYFAPSPTLNSSAQIRKHITVSNVYVATTEYGTTGTPPKIFRFPAGVNTSTPNTTITLADGAPLLIRVSPYNGRVVLLHESSQTVVVFDKDLNKLYSFVVPHTDVHDFAGSAAYDSNGDLFVGVTNVYDYYGHVYEYLASDTSPDYTYSFHSNDFPLSIAFAPGSNVPFYEGRSTVWTCTTGATYSCQNTHIPSYSLCFYSVCPSVTASIALTDTNDLGEMYSSSGYSPQTIKLYSNNVSGWTYASSEQRCNNVMSNFIQDYTTDVDATEYYACYAGSVIERQSGGTKYKITGLAEDKSVGGAY